MDVSIQLVQLKVDCFYSSYEFGIHLIDQFVQNAKIPRKSS